MMPAEATTVLHKFESQITEVPAVGPPPVEEPVPSAGKLGGIEALTVDWATCTSLKEAGSMSSTP